MRTIEEIGYLRWLGAVFVQVLTTPGTLAGAAGHLVFGALITWFMAAKGMLDHTLGRVAYATFITLLALAILGTVWYHLRLWVRWARIRRASGQDT
jgi:hypothetical protein